MGVSDTRLKVGVDVGLLTAGGGGFGMSWTQAKGAWHRVTPGSGRFVEDEVLVPPPSPCS